MPAVFHCLADMPPIASSKRSDDLSIQYSGQDLDSMQRLPLTTLLYIRLYQTIVTRVTPQYGVYIMPVVPHKAVAEVSKIVNL